jgi:hypothetical protein
MSIVALILGTVAFVGGGTVIFIARRARHRVGGLAVMALGSLLALTPVASGAPGVAAAAGVIALTLVGLVLVAHLLEGRGRRADRGHGAEPDRGADLDLDEDPGR